MLRGFSRRYTEPELIQFLEDAGLTGTFSGIFMPRSKLAPETENHGYFFVRLISECYFDLYLEKLAGRTFGPRGKKLLVVELVELADVETQPARHNNDDNDKDERRFRHRQVGPFCKPSADLELLGKPRELEDDWWRPHWLDDCKHDSCCSLIETFCNTGHQDHSELTIMVRNISRRYTAPELFQFLEEAGLGGTFLGIFVPRRKLAPEKENHGYFFVRLISQCYFDLYQDRLAGQTLGPRGKKLLQVELADHQTVPEWRKRHRRGGRCVPTVNPGRDQGLGLSSNVRQGWCPTSDDQWEGCCPTSDAQYQ